MKVLFIANSCCSPITSPKRYYTGYDYIVSDIAVKLNTICHVDIFSLSPCPIDATIGDVPVKSCVTYKRLLKYFKFGDIFKYIKIIFNSIPDIRKALKNILWYLELNDIDDLIKKNDYDLIHIHGVSFGCFISSYAATKNTKPFLFTLHGLLSYGVPDILNIDKKSEQYALDVIKKNSFYVTTVSTGTKNIPCEDKSINKNKFIVINNAIKTSSTVERNYWYNRFPKIKGKTIIIGVGTVGPNKNQIQLIRAYKHLPKEVQDDVAILFAGKDITNGYITNYVKEHNLQENVFLCGFVNKTELSNLYAIADYNVMLSISEGFGLSMIEAASYGIPSLTFSDLDAVKDIYSPNYMLTMDDRSDESVAIGIKEMMSKVWNKDLIIKESQKFNENIYLQYLEVYNKIICEGSNIVAPRTINGFWSFLGF